MVFLICVVVLFWLLLWGFALSWVISGFVGFVFLCCLDECVGYLWVWLVFCLMVSIYFGLLRLLSCFGFGFGFWF